jgi:hypothetical protein
MRQQQDKNKNQSDHAASAGKKTYRAPRLTVYGDLRTITKAKGGTKADGGAPATKA